MAHSRLSRSQTCYYCSGRHSCRECPQEKLISPIMKKLVGMYMENIVANKIKCPKCIEGQLTIIGTHAPSLDIVCNNCETKFEIKSKCISATDIPNDLILPHGSYFDYINRLEEGLEFIIIVYGVDRKTKIINIRKILYIPHETLRGKQHINIIKKNDSTLSEIYIPDNRVLNHIILNKNYSYDFSKNIDTILQNNNLLKILSQKTPINIIFT
jgi:hypothetical protein